MKKYSPLGVKRDSKTPKQVFMKQVITTDFFSTLDFELFKKSILALLGFGDYKNSQEKSLKSLENYLGIERTNMSFFLNARSAMYHTLKSQEVGPGDEVIITGWNCVSVVNLILQTGAVPVFADIYSESFSLSLESVEKKITLNTKAIILQETFGMPIQDFDKIIQYCKQKDIYIVADGAHSFGNSILQDIDAHVYSFGRDKVISSVSGGLLVFSKNVPEYFRNMKLQNISNKQVRKHLYYNIFGYLALKTYGVFGVGKVIMLLARKFQLFPEILSKSEKKCDFNDFNFVYPKKLFLILKIELSNYKKVELHRKEITNIYINGLEKSRMFALPEGLHGGNYFRIPLILQDKDLRVELLHFMKQHNMYLGSQWSGGTICPIGSEIQGLEKSTPIASTFAQKTVFLPNHRNVSEKDAVKILELLQKFEEKHVKNI
ncbi:aminotransferase class V-fold PLP-dependent enzyme [Candidatus Gracilibacteria bacterium]|nr:aminotransferase class V-fold PLP-dependent enzyme [Candidatus Gracilibacteria bacterium]